MSEETIIVNPEDIIFDEETEQKKKKFFDKFSKTNPEDLKFDSISKMNVGQIKKIWTQVLSLWKVVKSDSVTISQKAMAVGALVYLISPVDAILDTIPVIGLTDDAAVITLVATQLVNVIKAINKASKVEIGN